MIGKHCFVFDSGEMTALIMTSLGVYDRENCRVVQNDDLMHQLGADIPPRPVSPKEGIFMAWHKGLRTLMKAKD